MHAYTDADESLIDSQRRVHANGEQTHVHVLTAGDEYVAVAVDVDPRSFDPVAAAAVAYDPTEEGASERAERWLAANPKGVAGESAGGSGGGWLRRIFGALKRIDGYGNDLVASQQQTDDEGGD